MPDLLDGALAKASGRASARGAFFDSVADRVTDALVLGAVAWYLMDHHPGHIALLPVAVMGTSMLVSYERAKAESLGFQAKGGLMERAERVVVLCAGLAFSFLLIPLLWLMLALTVVDRRPAIREGVAAGERRRAAAAASGAARTGAPVELCPVRAARRGRPLAGVAGGERLGASLGPLRRRLPAGRGGGPLAGAQARLARLAGNRTPRPVPPAAGGYGSRRP